MKLESHDTLTMQLSSQDDMSLNIAVPKLIRGTSNYEELNNKPQIESIELIGNKTFPELGISPIDVDDLIDILN